MDGIVLVRPDAIMSNNDISVRDEMGIVDVLRSTASYLISYYLTITRMSAALSWPRRRLFEAYLISLDAQAVMADD